MKKIISIFIIYISISEAMSQSGPTSYCQNYLDWLYYKVQSEPGSSNLYTSLSKMGLFLSEIDNKHLSQLDEIEKSEFKKIFDHFKYISGYNNLLLNRKKEELTTEQFNILYKSFFSKIKNKIKVPAEYFLTEWDHFVVSTISRPTSLLSGRNNLNLYLDPIVKNNSFSSSFFDEFKKDCPAYDYESEINIKCNENVQTDFAFNQLNAFLYKQYPKALKPVSPPIKINYPFAGEENFKKYSNWSKVEYATRPSNIITTLIFHHTESSNDTSVYSINRFHRNKPEGWLMIAYNYTINDDKNATINEARPPHIKGGHAGKESVIKQKTEYEHIKYLLPSDGIPYGLHNQHLYAQKVQSGEIPADQVDINKMPKITKDELYKDEGVSANALSMGIAIIGSYIPGSTPSHPADLTIDQAARLACHLQFKYPNIKTIGGHRQYSYKSIKDFLRTNSCKFVRNDKGNRVIGEYKNPGTGCPGSILLDTLYKIQAKAREYECEFEVNTDWVNYPCDPAHERYYHGGGT